MSMWIQHGYGKGTKIDAVAATGRIGGVVLSPGDEEPAALRATARTAVDLGLAVLLDPQLYVHTFNGGAARCSSECAPCH